MRLCFIPFAAILFSYLPAQSKLATLGQQDVENHVSVDNGDSKAIFKREYSSSQPVSLKTDWVQSMPSRQIVVHQLPWFKHPELRSQNEQITQQYAKIMTATKQQSVATTFVVTNPSDDGDSNLSDNIFSPQTLRSAIQNANKTDALDAISFSGVTSIQPITELPVATKPILLDGTISGGKIVLDGALTVNKSGLWIIGSSTVKNMKFTNWGGTALALAINTGAGNNIVQSCEFYHNKGVGININTDNNLIGGMQPEEKNIVTDNVYNPSNFRTGYGIAVLNGSDNIVANNFIGTTDGINSFPNDYGLYVEGLRNKVYQNLISGNMYGLALEGDYRFSTPNGNLVENNLIGTDATGNAKLPNSLGIYFTDNIGDTIRSNTISGNNGGINGGSGASKRMHIYDNAVGFNISRSDTLPNKGDGISTRGDFHLIEKNFVAGNGGNGIYLADGDSSIVRTNMIGTDITGKLPLGNRLSGIVLELARGVIVGGNSFSDANIIGANGEAGVKIHYSSGSIVTSGNCVMHNYIGTNAANDNGLGNFYGVSILRNAPKNIIESNVIARNKRHGIYLYRFVQTGDSTFIRKNFIGTDSTATIAMGNDSAGVMIEEGNGNIIGGDNVSDGNTIMYNGIDGVFIKKGVGNSILSNTIKKNKQLSIDLGDEGPTENDSIDTDSGANNLQNFPIITFIKINGGNTDVTGYLKSIPLKQYKIQFYSHEKPDTTGFGEGEEYQKTEMVNSDSSGTAKFITTISGIHRRIVATATDPNGNTSEFSKSPIIVNSAGNAPDNNATDGFADTGGLPVNGAPEVTLRAAIQTSNQLKGEDYISFDIPGSSPQFINPASSLPVVLGDITIDGSTQSGYDPTSVQAIQLLGASAGANVDGLNLAGDRSTIRALYISQFQGDGIETVNDLTTLIDVTSNSNKKSGVRSSHDITLEGESTFNGNGPAALTSPQCDDHNNAGLWVTGWLRGKGKVTATGNCGAGIYLEGLSYPLEGGIHLEASVTANGNSSGGIFANDNVWLRGEKFDFSNNGSPKITASGIYLGAGGLTIEATGGGDVPLIKANNNSSDGLFTSIGPITLKGKAQCNNNGAGRTPIECFNYSISGIKSRGDLRTTSLEVIGNGMDGIKAGESFYVEGNLTVKDHPGRGIWTIMNISLDGTEHLIENNLDQAMWAANGWLNVKGKLIVRNNKIGGNHGVDEGPKETDSRVGSVQAWKDITVEDVDIENNEPSGIAGWDNVWIKGQAISKNNLVSGIFAMDELRIDGSGNVIMGNGGEGLATNNQGIIVNGSIIIDGNGKNGSLLEIDQTERCGAIAQYVRMNDVVVRNNERAGIVGYNGIDIRGRGIISGNGSDGLFSNKFVQISGGRINNNKGYGIASPVVRMSGTQVSNNEHGGISGKVLGAPTLAKRNILFKNTSSIPPLKSIIRGSAITENSGNGITVDTQFPFAIEGSNISNNTGFGIKNAGSGQVIAEGNWWGNASGPGASINGIVQAASWQSSSVGLYVGLAEDSIFVLPGEVDSISIVAANWFNPNDSLSLDAVDNDGWLQLVIGRTIALHDSTPSVTTVHYSIPGNAVVGDTSKIIISEKSLISPAATTKDTVYFVVYSPSLYQLLILKDTLITRTGDTLRITAVGFDQKGKEKQFIPVWSASGGSITNSGLYVAGKDTGLYIVRVVDSLSGKKDSTAIHIIAPSNSGAPAVIAVSATTIDAGNINPGTQSFPQVTITNNAVGILSVDSVKTLTKYFTAVRSPDVNLVRQGDTLTIVITFSPDSNKTFHDTLFIHYNSPLSPKKILLSGKGITTGIEIAEKIIPTEYLLQQNYPNPFNPSTTIRFGVPVTSTVRLTVYNILGKEIAHLVNGICPPGYVSVVWSAPVASGIYFYRIESISVEDPAKKFSQTRRMMFIK